MMPLAAMVADNSRHFRTGNFYTEVKAQFEDSWVLGEDVSRCFRCRCAGTVRQSHCEYRAAVA